MAISRFVFLQSFGLPAEMLTTRPSGIVIDLKIPSGRPLLAGMYVTLIWS